ncbi:hypothetical protein, variant [Sphaeroforma arctica JP610]|uniref:3-hydroxyacyl-CoA dehydrogenase C-terminal domain-containing protein n=1 Tax=Sphaeroforma arctica JP610 TaxID=667725 RepID=A0A0L0G3L5_9EUKA|nr:hypothetical protein, variant [Sphaeroforma arctica JP610]KNC83431.1 hypothetical protein, variant [Sphaeroforma arctica JP610]|eukprot:XP_014157333.1 hypothetical protein, variant [Sphaeroforma arctica JP610]
MRWALMWDVTWPQTWANAYHDCHRETLLQMEKGWVGRKSQAGLYTYSGKKKSINEDAIALFKRHGAAIQRTTEDADLPLRMACRMANEAVMCLQEGVLAKASDGDVGAVFGLGFPPAKGGPFRWLDTYGAQNVVDHLDRFRETFGEQFTVCDLLRENAKSEKKFY